MKLGNLPTICDRCQSPLKSHIMSKLNKDILCMPCKHDETTLSSYQAGEAAELEAVRQGNYNFPGIGLTASDHVLLAEKRAERPAPRPQPHRR